VFRLTDFPQTFRGFYLPVIITALRHFIGHGSWAWRVFINVLVSIEFAVILPALFGDSVEEKKKMLRSLVAFVVFIWLWGNYLQYPLSDFVAFFFFSAAVVLMINLLKKEKAISRIIYGIICGVLLYLAYNTRVSYLWGGMVLIAVALASSKKKKQLAFVVLAVGMGILVAAFPQMLINQKNEGSFTPRIYTENYMNSQNLQFQQVLWGITYPRYETCANLEEYSSPAMFFVDPVGTEVIGRQRVDVTTFQLKQYIKLWIKNPLDLITVYTRHFISAATPSFTRCYVTELRQDRSLILITIVILWFLATVSLVEKLKKKEAHTIGWLIPIVLPSVLQMLGAVEIRFFLPIYALIIYYVCTVIDFRELHEETKTKKLALTVVFLVVFLLWATVYSDLLAMNVETVFLINE
jgi:ABC-type multidrug transport system fused ATPase/permease subunit